MFQTSIAANAAIGGAIALFLCLRLPDGIGFPKDRIHTQIEILNDKIGRYKDNADLSGFIRIYIGKVGLQNKKDPVKVRLSAFAGSLLSYIFK